MANDTEPNTEQGERLTVSEAAARLGVSARYVRRLLERPDLAALVEQGTRQTRTGERGTRLIPPALMWKLRGATAGKMDAEPNRERGPEQNAAEQGTHALPEQKERMARNMGTGSKQAAALPEPDQLSPLGARLVAEMEGRISDLQKQLEAANAALAREQQNHARTQALAALPAPVEQHEAEKKSGRGGASVVNESPLRARLKVRLGHV